jgi:hypothetical protein
MSIRVITNYRTPNNLTKGKSKLLLYKQTKSVNNRNTSTGFTDLERSIDDLDQNIEEVCKETHSILASMVTEKSACYFKIKDFRLSADKRLDELEQNLLDELEQIYIKQKSKVQGVADTCLSKTRGSQEPVIAHLVFNLTSKVDRKWGCYT